jgi:hypothetical protein
MILSAILKIMSCILLHCSVILQNSSVILKIMSAILSNDYHGLVGQKVAHGSVVRGRCLITRLVLGHTGSHGLGARGCGSITRAQSRAAGAGWLGQSARSR